VFRLSAQGIQPNGLRRASKRLITGHRRPLRGRLVLTGTRWPCKPEFRVRFPGCPLNGVQNGRTTPRWERLRTRRLRGGQDHWRLWQRRNRRRRWIRGHHRLRPGNGLRLPGHSRYRGYSRAVRNSYRQRGAALIRVRPSESECGADWQRARFGSERSQVRSLPL
jgi:hypothetical protein